MPMEKKDSQFKQYEPQESSEDTLNELKRLMFLIDSHHWKECDIDGITLKGEFLGNVEMYSLDFLFENEIFEHSNFPKPQRVKKIGFLPFQANVIDLYHNTCQQKKITK